MKPMKENTENLYLMEQSVRDQKGIQSLPGSLEDALELLAKDKLLLEVLGDHVYTQYVKGKKKEVDEYRTRVSQWEIEKYLMNY